MKNSKKIIGSLAGAGLLIVTVVLVSFWTFHQIKKAAETRQYTSVVLNRAENILSELKDAETGQRGYLLTGNESFLEPYLAVRDNIFGHLEELNQLTRINTAQNHLKVMTPLIIAKLAALSHIIELRRNNEITPKQAVANSGQAKLLMDSIRSEMKKFIQIEETALAHQETDFQLKMHYLFIFIIAISLFVLLFALTFVYLVYQETQQRLKNLVHYETKHLLKIQEETNKQLQQTNIILQISEEKSMVMLNSIGDAVMAMDEEGHVTLLNPLAEQLTGWTQKEAIGRPVEEIFHIINQETMEPVIIPIKETLALGTTQIMASHTILIARSGSECSIADSCAPIRSRDGRVIGAVMVFRDVTERIKIENGLEKTRIELAVIKKIADEASEFSESIINTVREPLISLDQDLRVVTVSRSFYDVFKVNPEETVGQLIYDLGNKQWDIPKLRELLETILPQKASFDNYEVEHDFTTIGRRIMLLNARQIQRESGKERIILLAIEDITERKQIEIGLEKAHEELRVLTNELKRAAQAKSDFLANMSHELRTPLNSVNGFSEVLYDETFGPLNQKQKKYVSNILTSGKHLLLLINQILDMAKVESGRMTLSLSSISLQNLLEEIALLVTDLASKKRLEMVIEIADDLPIIEADELKMKEIIYNLLSNAVKFTPEGGKIGIRANRTDSQIEIVVWDTGIGIAAENMNKIFEGFFRVDTPYSRLIEGTGLGLPISKKLAELHGGELHVESEGLNKGTSVRFVLSILSKRAARNV